MKWKIEIIFIDSFVFGGRHVFVSRIHFIWFFCVNNISNHWTIWIFIQRTEKRSPSLVRSRFFYYMFFNDMNKDSAMLCSKEEVWFLLVSVKFIKSLTYVSPSWYLILICNKLYYTHNEEIYNTQRNSSKSNLAGNCSRKKCQQTHTHMQQLRL